MDALVCAPLNIERLRYRWPGAEWTLAVDSLTLAPGEQLLLTAGSGAGKSTLLQLIAGLIDPDAGRVEVADTDVHALRGGARDRFRGAHVGMIFQTFNLLGGFSALENVMAAMLFAGVPANEQRLRGRALLARLDVRDPDRDVDRLSVGQQQRVAVARAIACRPALVLADEPTASLDPVNGAIAMELIQSTCREAGAALLCTSHDPAMVERFERRVELAALAIERPAA